MFDELEHLRVREGLCRLLGHYAGFGAADREAWQDRLMQLEGVGKGDLAKLHGELIAYGWVEQNTGVTTGSRPGVVAGCYRITSQGQRALRWAQSKRPDVEEEAEAA